MKGLYAGSLPNLGRCMLKNSYRYPLMVGLPTFYKKHLPIDNKELLRFLTGLSIACSETIILCPFERLKVLFMTKAADNNMGYIKFFKQSAKDGTVISELYRGTTPLLAR